MTFCDVIYSSLMPYPVYKVEPCGLTYLGANVGSWRKMATNGDVIFGCFKFGINSLKVIYEKLRYLRTEPNKKLKLH